MEKKNAFEKQDHMKKSDLLLNDLLMWVFFYSADQGERAAPPSICLSSSPQTK